MRAPGCSPVTWRVKGCQTKWQSRQTVAKQSLCKSGLFLQISLSHSPLVVLLVCHIHQLKCMYVFSVCDCVHLCVCLSAFSCQVLSFLLLV